MICNRRDCREAGKCQDSPSYCVQSPYHDGVRTLRALYSTHPIVMDAADEIEKLRAHIREAFDVLPDDPFDAYRVLKHSGV